MKKILSAVKTIKNKLIKEELPEGESKKINAGSKKAKETGIDLKKEIIEEFVEKSKQAGVLTYEELIEFGDKHQLTEAETNDMLKTFEKEHVDLVTQEEFDKTQNSLDDFQEEEEVGRTNIKSHLDGSLDSSGDQYEDEEEGGEEDEDDEREVVREAGASQITDPVKCYLRDIGKISLLNKKTETIIADQIALSKKESIDVISHFPLIHKEFATLGEKLKENSLPLKAVIQFSEFDEENVPKFDEEKKHLLSIIKTIQDLIDNED